MPRRQKLELGDTFRDRLSGWEGHAIARYEYVSGCVQYCLERLDKDGKREHETFDEQRLEKVKVNAKTRVHRTGADTVPPSPAR
jgi:hypothetical protein